MLTCRSMTFPVFLISAMVACGGGPDRGAVDAVARLIDSDNKLTISRADLATVPNPKGAGVIVYAAQGRPALWVVVEGQPYAMNAPAKTVTPSARWPREAPPGTWQATNIDPVGGTVELLKVVGRD